MSGPSGPEFIGQTNRHIGRQQCPTSLEGAPHRIDKDGLAKFECLRDQPEIVEILEPAVGHAERDQGLEFLRHNRLDRVGAKMGCWRIQQRGIVDLDWRWRDGVAEADVDLDRDACAGDSGRRGTRSGFASGRFRSAE